MRVGQRRHHPHGPAAAMERRCDRVEQRLDVVEISDDKTTGHGKDPDQAGREGTVTARGG